MHKLIHFLNCCMLCLFVLLIGCEPAVTFETAQPDGAPDEAAFSNGFVGQYISKSDSSILTIQQKLVTREATGTEVVAVNRLDTMGYKFKDGKLYEKYDHKGIPAIVKNDTVYATWHITDTLFSFTSRQTLRAMKGYYFMNYQSDSGSYKVLSIGLENGKLEMGCISVSNDIAELQQNTHVKEYKNDHQVTTHYSSKPSKEEFGNFVKHGGFSNREVFTKVI